MRLLIVVFLTFLSTIAKADPVVGDSAKFSFFRGDLLGQGINGTVELLITGTDIDGSLTITRTEIINGTTWKEKFVVEPGVLKTSAQIADDLAYCEIDGGTAGTYTLHGEAIPTCTYLNPSTYTLSRQIADVPFGFVTDDSRDQNHVYTNLKMESFSR